MGCHDVDDLFVRESLEGGKSQSTLVAASGPNKYCE